MWTYPRVYYLLYESLLVIDSVVLKRQWHRTLVISLLAHQWTLTAILNNSRRSVIIGSNERDARKTISYIATRIICTYISPVDCVICNFQLARVARIIHDKTQFGTDGTVRHCWVRIDLHPLQVIHQSVYLVIQKLPWAGTCFHWYLYFAISNDTPSLLFSYEMNVEDSTEVSKFILIITSTEQACKTLQIHLILYFGYETLWLVRIT